MTKNIQRTMTPEALKLVAARFKVLAEPLRLQILQQLDARAWAANETASDPLQRVDKQLTFHLIPKRFEHATFAVNGCCRAANVVKLISLRQNRRLNHG